MSESKSELQVRNRDENTTKRNLTKIERGHDNHETTNREDKDKFQMTVDTRRTLFKLKYLR